MSARNRVVDIPLLLFWAAYFTTIIYILIRWAL